MDRRPIRPRSDRRLKARWQADRRKQRLLITVGIVFVLVVLGVLSYGYYASYIGPARIVAARVGNTSITMGQVVKYMRGLQALGAYSDSKALASAAQETLVSLVESEMAYQAALKQGVTASEAEITLAVHSDFYPQVAEGEEVDDATLEREFRENYRSFLAQTGLSDAEYRKIKRNAIIQSKMRAKLVSQIPNQAEHVEVSWIAVPFGQNYQQASQKLKDGVDWADVCAEYNTDATYATEDCYVGWVPRGAFPKLDDTLFSIEHGVISDPIYADTGMIILKVTDGPEVRDIIDTMKTKMENEAFGNWVNSLWEEYRATQSVRLNYNSDLDAWARKELRQVVRPTPTPA